MSEQAEHVESTERFPEREQAPIANDANEAIVGDPGFGANAAQQGTPSANTPHASSPPPPQFSGTPETRGQGDVETVQDQSGGSDSPPSEGAQQQGGRATGPVAGQPGEPQRQQAGQQQAAQGQQGNPPTGTPGGAVQGENPGISQQGQQG